MELLADYAAIPERDLMSSNKVRAAVYQLFTSVATYGSRLTVPEDRISLFALLKEDFDTYLPIVDVYLKAIDQKSMVDSLGDLRRFLAKNVNVFVDCEVEAFDKLLEPRSLLELCRTSIYETWRPCQVQYLPLPTMLKTYILSLSD